LRFLQQATVAPGAAADVGLAVDEAHAWLQQNQPNRALQVLAQVPASAQPAGVAADMAALIYAASGDDAHAIAAFRVALATGAGQPAIARDAATFLGSRGHWAEALDVIRNARRQAPDSPELALEEAIFLQLAGHRAEAQQQLRALAFDPADPALSPAQRRAAVLLGISYYTSDDREKAEALFRQLTESAPKLPQPWYYRALLASETNQAAEALTWVRRALRLDPDSAEAWYLEGKLLAASRQLPAAHAAFQQAIQHDPAWNAPHFALARVLRDQGDAAAAATQITAFHQLSKGESQGEKQQLRSFLQEQLRTNEND
jgi:Tfp pilus assembly protein PilF